MPCLGTFLGYGSVEGAARAEGLAAAHAMHADTARLAALQDRVVTLRAKGVLNEGCVAFPGVCWYVLALSCERAVLRPQRLTILSLFGDLPKSAIVVSQPSCAFHRSYAVARAPESVERNPDLHVLRGCASGVVVLPAVASAARCRTPCCVGPDAELVAYLDELMCGVRVRVAADERGGEIGSTAVVTAAVGVEALQSKLAAHPRGVF